MPYKIELTEKSDEMPVPEPVNDGELGQEIVLALDLVPAELLHGNLQVVVLWRQHAFVDHSEPTFPQLELLVEVVCRFLQLPKSELSGCPREALQGAEDARVVGCGQPPAHEVGQDPRPDGQYRQDWQPDPQRQGQGLIVVLAQILDRQIPSQDAVQLDVGPRRGCEPEVGVLVYDSANVEVNFHQRAARHGLGRGGGSLVHHVDREALGRPVVLDPDVEEPGAIGGQLEPEVRQGHGVVRAYAVDVEANVVRIGIEVLLKCVELDRDQVVPGAPVSGRVGQPQVLAGTSLGNFEIRGDHEGQPLARSRQIVDPVDVHDEGRVERRDPGSIPEPEPPIEEDSAGPVCERIVPGGVRRYLKDLIADHRRRIHLEYVVV